MVSGTLYRLVAKRLISFSIICRFLGQECSLMKYRLDSLSDEERASFMLSNGMDFDPVSTEEKNSRKDKLIDLAGVTNVSIIKTTFYKYVCLFCVIFMVLTNIF